MSGARWTDRAVADLLAIGDYIAAEAIVRTYRIVYRITPGGIVVLTVFEGHRLLGQVDPEADE